MTRPLPEIRLAHPATIGEAVGWLAGDPDARPLAGGTDLIVNMRRGLQTATTLVDLSDVEGLDGIRATGEGLRIGAGTRLAHLETNPDVTPYGAVVEAAAAVAAPGHRAAATVGGNLCLDTRCLYYNQSDWWRQSTEYCLKYRGQICHVAPQGNRCRAAFSGDLAPALMVHGAEVEIAGRGGTRRLPLAGLYREDGADHLTLEPGEIVVAVHLPPPTAVSAYGKIRIRGAIDFPLAGVAVACTRADPRTLAVAVTGTNSCPITVDPPGPCGARADDDTWFAALDKAVQKAVSPQRTTTVAAHYRRLAAAATAVRLARRLAAE